MRHLPLLLSLSLLAPQTGAGADSPLSNGSESARSFVDQSEIVSKYTSEQYAHQSSLRIIDGKGYAAYQCNEATPEENKAGQIVRLAIFDIVRPSATATWLDIARAGELYGGLTLGGTFVASPMLHAIGPRTLRICFVGRLGGDSVSLFRAFYRDLNLGNGVLSELKQARCTIAKDPAILDLSQASVQKHLDFLFGQGFGDSFATGITNTCDFHAFDNQLYSTIQIKNSKDGETLLMTNILMRSADEGATWDLLGAPDPRQVPGEIKILAEPALTHDSQNIYLHLRSNVVDNGYMLSQASKTDLFEFSTPEKKWTYGIGRPAICDFGKPIGLVAMFTAPSVHLGGQAVTRNKVDVVMIDRSYSRYTRAFSIVDYNAVNTPFIHLYRDEAYVTYSTGKRRLHPKFATSEIVFSKLRREFFVSPD